MKNFQNIEILENEAERVLKVVNTKTASPMSMKKLMENITIAKEPMSDCWDVRLSKISAKDLDKWDNTKFTDGNHNGHTLQIRMGK